LYVKPHLCAREEFCCCLFAHSLWKKYIILTMNHEMHYFCLPGTLILKKSLLCCLTFWFMNILFRAYFQKNHGWKFIYDQDPDPNVFKSQIWIRSQIVRIRNTASKYESGFVRNAYVGWVGELASEWFRAWYPELSCFDISMIIRLQGLRWKISPWQLSDIIYIFCCLFETKLEAFTYAQCIEHKKIYKKNLYLEKSVCYEDRPKWYTTVKCKTFLVNLNDTKHMKYA
jgi:hypothetical protein